MDMKHFLGALSDQEKRTLKELLYEDKPIEVKVPTAIANLINAGEIRAASRQLATTHKKDLKNAWDECMLYMQSLPKWNITYTMFVDREKRPLSKPKVVEVEWSALNEDTVKRRFRDTWASYADTVILNSIKRSID